MMSELRLTDFSRSLSWRRTASPAAWPAESLIVLKWSRRRSDEREIEHLRGQRTLGRAVVPAVQEGHFLLDVLGQEAAVGQARERVGDAGLGQLLVGVLELVLALGQLSGPLLHAGLQHAGVLDLPIELPLLDADHAHDAAGEEQAVGAERPAGGPGAAATPAPIGRLVVPAPVAVGGA
jgi:hypothetical protein